MTKQIGDTADRTFASGKQKYEILDAEVLLAAEWMEKVKHGNLSVQFHETEDGEITEIYFIDNLTDEIVGIIGNKEKLM